ncbi:MAG: type IV secretion system DNA-binding domain-containing protein [Patescibacteria group bacterium]|nr:type IV secretion system DNA-binding domain-containing protein [Patescibacteria group bacterium]
MENNITYFAKTNFRGKEHKFGIKRDDRGRHTYVIGKTGMGKTNLLETMIIADIKSGNGLAVVDPHGDLAEKVLNFVPASRINDVVYFNPADVDYPIAFNVMEQVDLKYRHLVASGLIGVFKKIWADSWGPRLEYLLRNVILALLEYPGSTLLGVPRMFIDKDYRKKVVNKVTDPVVKAFWLNEFTKYSSQFTVDAISPIQNKVGQFLSSSLVRNIISQTHSTIDMREIMDNRKILIINLAKGRIGEDYSALLGAMLITKIQLAAMGRSDIPEEERKDFYLYVDEFQNFATESFAGILSEARKYRLNLIIAHQYIGQLEEEVRDAIFGNVGTLISFRVGAADAEWLEKEFEPVFMMNDLVNLAKYDIYLKLMINGVTGDAFSATTLPPSEVTEQSNAEKIIKVSRERYANKREVVEDKISRWSGMDDENKKVEKINNKNENYEKNEIKINNTNEEKETWDAVCEICEEKIKVPFKPDPKRSTYCKNCLVEVRKQSAESANSKAENNVPKKKEEEIKSVEPEKEITKPDDFKENVVKQETIEKKEDKKEENEKSSINEFSKKDKEIENEIQESVIKDNIISPKKSEIKEESISDTIQDDRTKKDSDLKTTNQSTNLKQDKVNDIEMKEGEIIKFD